MTAAMHAEWTKLRTVTGTSWLLLAAAGLTIGLSALVSAAVHCSVPDCQQDAVKLSLIGIEVGQAVIAILAVMVISGEYGTGMIQATLTATPRRPVVLAAKAAVLSGAVLVTGTIAVLGSLLVARLSLPANGFTPAHGYPPLSLADPPTLRAAVGSVLYLILIALLSLGVATAVRESATAIGIVLALLYLFPIIAAATSNPKWHKHLEQIAPMNAGLAIQATRHLTDLAISPWAGLAVLLGWAAAGLVLGGLLLQYRDA